MERKLEESRSQDGRSPSPELRPQKLNHPVLDTGVSNFSRMDRVQLGFEI
jgi:hypothetical protein